MPQARGSTDPAPTSAVGASSGATRRDGAVRQVDLQKPRRTPTGPRGGSGSTSSPADDGDEPDASAEEAETAGGGRRLALVLLSLAAVALLAGLAVLLLSLHNHTVAEQRRAAALEAGRRGAVALTTYQPTMVTQQFDATLTLLGGPFREEFVKSRAKAQEVVTTLHVNAKGDVLAAGVQTISSSKALVLVSLDDHITSGAFPGDKVTHYRFTLSLQRSGSTWLVVGFDTVSGAGGALTPGAASPAPTRPQSSAAPAGSGSPAPAGSRPPTSSAPAPAPSASAPPSG